MTAAPIVLIEDNPDDEELCLLALKTDRVSNPVIVMRDGAEALEKLLGPGAAAGARPCIILLDLKLPKVDGIEVLRRLRASEAHSLTPVVILTSSREERDVLDGYGFGANSYIVKPVDFEQFTAAIRHLQLYWLVLNRPPP